MNASRASRALVLSMLLATLLTGILLGIKATRPTWAVNTLPMQTLVPLHTLGAFAILLTGLSHLLDIVLARIAAERTIPFPALTLLLLAFLLLAAGAILSGRGSGLEYTSWPTVFTLLPVAACMFMLLDVIRHLKRLCDLTPEGTWLLLIGLCLAPLGLAERAASASANWVTRSLMIEWHSLDTIFAGFNTSLYGLAMLLAPAPGRPLRSRWLYALALLALLSTFGHHHYLSAQPRPLKLIALAASMLGAVSFIRHIAASRRALRTPLHATDAGRPLVLAATLWTAFAVGSGVLLAIPQVNLVLHGTHAIVAHSMGAIIGVNIMLVLGSILSATGAPASPAVRRGAAVANILLIVIIADLSIAGSYKGIIRLGGTHHDYQPWMRLILSPLPILGAGFAAAMAFLCLKALGSPVPASIHRAPLTTIVFNDPETREPTAGPVPDAMLFPGRHAPAGSPKTPILPGAPPP
jgi:hypothetical protein